MSMQGLEESLDRMAKSSSIAGIVTFDRKMTSFRQSKNITAL